ncbi:MAG: hypothetical protein ACKVTZ_19220, partial [Bacteroidia bacterium]
AKVSHLKGKQKCFLKLHATNKKKTRNAKVEAKSQSSKSPLFHKIVHSINESKFDKVAIFLNEAILIENHF